jgi:hypothetical protein
MLSPLLAALVFTHLVAVAPASPSPSPAISAVSAAQHDLNSINQSLDALQDETAAEYVGYALNHQVFACGANWPNGITPTVPEVDKYMSACYLLQDPTLSQADVTMILSEIPDWPYSAHRHHWRQTAGQAP